MSRKWALEVILGLSIGQDRFFDFLFHQAKMKAIEWCKFVMPIKAEGRRVTVWGHFCRILWGREANSNAYLSYYTGWLVDLLELSGPVANLRVVQVEHKYCSKYFFYRLTPRREIGKCLMGQLLGAADMSFTRALIFYGSRARTGAGPKISWDQ